MNPRAFLGLLVLCFVVLLSAGRAAPPKIELIEAFRTNQVLIHFDTEANLTYELQASETLAANGSPDHTWTNLFVAPNTLFPNHYVVVDTRTLTRRFYRLRVVAESAR